MPERSLYRDEGASVEGSVLLRVVSGARPTSEQVEAIRFLLASAVDGLTTENVSVLDDSGRVLSAATEPQVAAQADRRRLEMQREVEAYLETRAAELVEPMLGAANVRVRISALLDTERVERRTDAVDPNAQVLTAEERSEIEPGDPSQGAASTIQHNTFDVTRSTEVSLSLPGAVRRLTVAVAVNENSPRLQDPGVISRIETLVANAVGFDTQRGDAISVVAVPFEPVATPEMFPTDPGPGPMDLIRDFQRPILLALALLLTFVLALRGLKIARAMLPAAVPDRVTGAGERSVVGAGGVGSVVEEGDRTERFAVGPPADASRLVRAWLSEG
jgi:flagellar M-ring protein FliF